MAIHVQRSLTIPDAELDEKFSASGGPGGQHANKAATRVELTWNIETSQAITERQRQRLIEFFDSPFARVVVDDERSQLRNREIAEARLAGRIRTALTPVKSRKPTKPSKGAKRRRVEGKRRRSERKRLRQRPSMDD